MGLFYRNMIYIGQQGKKRQKYEAKPVKAELPSRSPLIKGVKARRAGRDSDLPITELGLRAEMIYGLLRGV